MGRRRKGQDVNGWLVLDKAVGLTSTEAVSRVRRFFDARKAGHAGTLDPLASGLLPIALGEATKTVPVLMEGAKRYRFTIRWGEARATDDLEGPVEATSAARPSQADIEGQLPAFIGDIAQLPPRYSAVKINGERAYDLARRGENPEPKSRCVTVHDLKLIACPDRDHATLELACGKGTYVRSLARDLGKALGTYGAVSDLRRTGVSPFLEEDAISLEKLDLIGNSAAHQEALLPVATALDDIPALAV
ncbi:MAG: tRNA pseudouridine(55) synthase TruB, partial [Pseudomonadota bacterium]